MACPDHGELLSLHQGNATPAWIRTHIDGCPTCAQQLFRLRVAPGSVPTPTAAGVEPVPLSRVTGTLDIGSRIGRYVVLGQIGSGGMGVVHAAHDPELDRKLAIKLLQPSAEGATATLLAQPLLLLEAQAMAKLSHPNVVAVFDVGMFGDRVFIAMELVDGVTLRAWLSEKPRTAYEIQHVMMDVGRGLAAAHNAGLIHRDLKPDNILVGKDGRARVMDFGIARATRVSVTPGQPMMDTSVPSLITGLVGTPAYMAPEQFEGASADELTDQFAFAVTLYEALYGKRPFTGHPLKRDPHQRWTVEAPPKDARPVPTWMRRIVLRGLATKSTERFASMGDLLGALEQDPRHRRARIAVAAAGVVALALAAGSYQAALSRERLVCRGFEQRTAELFSASKRAAVRASFIATGKSHAADAFDRTSAVLDAYASDWARTRTDACEATRVRGEQPEDVLTLRMVCLDRRLEEWSALIEVFGRADEQLVNEAVKAAYALTPLTECADIAALKARVPPPTEPQVIERIGALRTQLATLKALYDAGKYAEGAQLGEKIALEAQTTGYAPVAAQALNLFGSHQSQLEYPVASQTLERAFAEALAAHDDMLIADTATRLVRHHVERVAFDQAEMWARIAEAALTRIEKSGAMRGVLLTHLGGMAWRRGKLVEAREKLDAAAELYKAHTPPDDPVRGRMLVHRALILDEFGDRDGAIAVYGDAVNILTRVLGPDHPDTLLAHMNRAYTLASIGDFEGAAQMQEQNHRSLAMVLGEDHPTTLTALSNLAETYAFLGRAEEALAHATRAIEGFTRSVGADDASTSMARAAYALAVFKAGRIEEAVALQRTALAERRRTLGDAATETSQSELWLADVLLAAKKPAEALEYYERVLRLAEERNARGVEASHARLGVARALAAIGTQRPRAERLAREARKGFEATRSAQWKSDADAVLAQLMTR